MQKLPLLVAIAATAGAALAQNPRPVVQVDTAATIAEFPGVASDGNLSAILYQEDSDNSLWVATSDARGIAWNAPVRIDNKPGTSGNFILTRKSLRIGDGNIYAVWRDDRNAAVDDMYMTYSTDGGATWATDIWLDKGYAIGSNPVRDFAFDVEGDLLAVLIATDNGDEELYLVVSTSASTGTVSAAIPASTLNGLGDADAIDLEIEGDIVHFAHNHDVSGVNQTYYSAYDLASSSFLSQDVLVSGAVQLAGGDSAGAMDLSVSGNNVAIAWDVDDINGTVEELWVNVVQAGVAMGEVQVGTYTLGVNDVDQTTVLMNGNIVVVAWEDDRSGSDESYLASADITGGSLVFGADVAVTAGGGGFPALAGGGDYVACVSAGGAFPEVNYAIASNDGGMTFGSPFIVSDNSGFDVDFAEVAYNALYGNFVCSYLSDDSGANDAYAGGFRVQSVSAVGTFSTGSPINFAVDGFGMSEDGNFFGVLASASPGSQVGPDGRNLGLTKDLFFNRTRAGIPGSFSGSLAGGAGATPTLNMPPLAPGTTIYFIAVGFTSATSLYSITDVRSVVTL
jgi:hypothetical protein